MNQAKKQLFWNLGFLKPKFLGVEIVGNDVKLERGISCQDSLVPHMPLCHSPSA